MGSTTLDVLGSTNFLAQWPTDWIIIGAIVAFAALDALRSGSARAAAVALALPTTLLLVNALSKAAFVGTMVAGSSVPYLELIVFVVIFGLLYFAIHRIIFTFSEGGGVIQSLLAGLAATIVLVVVWLQVPALDTLWHFGPQVQAVFAEAYRFWWLVVAYVALAAARS